jgi:hypothetical protein
MRQPLIRTEGTSNLSLPVEGDTRKDSQRRFAM